MKTKIIIFLWSILILPSLVAHADLQNFVRLHDYFDNTLKIQAGSFVGRGLTSNTEYQMTLLQYSNEAKETFVVVLEKLDNNLNIVHTRAYFATPITDTQSDLFEFVLDREKTMLLPPFEGKAPMTLNLSKVEKDHMMLELKPLVSDPQFSEIIRFHWGRTPQVYVGLRDTRFIAGKNEVRLWSDNEGSWADLTIADTPNGLHFFQR